MKSDIELVQEVKAGERKAFSELVQRHQRTLLRTILRLTREQSIAEDVVQESFIKAYQKIDLFEGRSSFKSWLFQIALNTARNRFRERTQDLINIEDTFLGVDPGAENGLVQADIKHKIREEIDKLPEKQRIALTLRIFEDMSFKEIAVIMGCPYDTAKANYRHALLKLRERLEDSDSVAGWDRFMEDSEGAWDGAMAQANARAPEVEQ
ncbi:MAG TPA: sigma-70 family RNA polymerase sigma factor [Bdellovibrionales bacterium]|nr:sigma-70 family RNA polymerase sigma factor [Bdellovibrionales bacterium]